MCIVYDDRMLKHCDMFNDNHPEKPHRINIIYKKYQEYNLLDRCYVQQVCLCIHFALLNLFY